MKDSKLHAKETYQIVNKICAGIDVHRDFVSVTLIKDLDQKGITTEYKDYPTIKKDLLDMRDWLVSNECKSVGIESTGKYWYAVHNALEGMIDVNVYNARNMKNLPGKKTDKADSEWIAKITRHALLMSSYIPDEQIRDARQYARNRKSLVQLRSSIRQMVHGLLDSASIKLSSVVSDIFGTSGANLIKLLLSGKPITESVIQKLVYGPLRHKTKTLKTAMDGYLRPTHIFILNMMLQIEAFLTDNILKLESELRHFLLDTPEHKAVYERILQIPGFSERSALLLLAEIGFDLRTFPSSKNFCSWAGLAPGKKESAGINKSGKIQTRQKYLKSLLVEVSLAASHCKDSFIKAKYFRFKSRIGTGKAIVAIAHSLCKAIYRAIKEGKDYRELSANYVSIDQAAKDLKSVSRISGRIGKDAIIAYLAQLENNAT